MGKKFYICVKIKNMKNLNLSLVVICAAIFISACSKSKIDILTSQKWKIASVTVAGGQMIVDCLKDDEIAFSKDLKVTQTPMGTLCGPSDTVVKTTTYSLSEDGKTFTYLYNNPPVPAINLTLNVNTLTEDTFNVSGMTQAGEVKMLWLKK